MENKLDSMYKLTKTLETAITMVDEDGVLTDEALKLISQAEMNITKKTESIFGVLRTLEGRVDMMKEEKSYINNKQNILKKNIEKLKEVIKMGLDTIPVELDKKGKKTQKIKTDRGTAFYKFSDNFEYNTEEIEDKYRVKKKKLQLSDNFDLEKLKEVAPDMVNEIEIEEIDYELLKFDYKRAEEDKKPKGIKFEEMKTLNVRK